MPPAANEPEIYPLTLDRYAVFEEIGRGGMARVHLARLHGPVGFSRLVALKRLRREVTTSDELTRLIDEARVGARIRHPNVVPVLDVVQQGDDLGVVMDYVHGPALAWLVARLERRGERWPTPIALRVALDVLYGLHAAHEARSERGTPLEVVHRDVSPQNVLLGSDGLARVADFGVARSSVRLALSRRGEVRGKLRYMAPEQRSGAPVDRRTDVFGAGVVLWELLTGRPLFSVDGATDATTIDPPSRHAAIPPALDEVVMAMLATAPAERADTAEVAAHAIEAVGAPIASHAEVARWLAPLADDLLAERSALIERAEQLSRAFVAPAAPGPSPSAPTTRSLAKTTESPATLPLAEPPPRTAGLPAPATLPMAGAPMRPSARPHAVAARTALSPVASASPPPRAPPRRVWIAGAALLVVAIGAVLAVVYLSGRTADRHRARGAGSVSDDTSADTPAGGRARRRRQPRTSSSEIP